MGRVNMQRESWAGQWRVCVLWRARSWGLSWEARALTLS